MGSWAGFTDFLLMSNYVIRNQKSPHLMIHSTPFAYGERKAEDTIMFLDRIRAEGRAKIESVFFDGNHHFHMIKPKQVSEICFNFLKRHKTDK